MTREIVKVTVNMSGDSLAALREMSDKQGRTMTEVIRGAIATEHYLRGQMAAGHRLLLERDGNFSVVILR